MRYLLAVLVLSLVVGFSSADWESWKLGDPVYSFCIEDWFLVNVSTNLPSGNWYSLRQDKDDLSIWVDPKVLQGKKPPNRTVLNSIWTNHFDVMKNRRIDQEVDDQLSTKPEARLFIDKGTITKAEYRTAYTNEKIKAEATLKP